MSGGICLVDSRPRGAYLLSQKQKIYILRIWNWLIIKDLRQSYIVIGNFLRI